jgi:hypothetical protein
MLTMNTFPAVNERKFYYFYQKLKAFNGNFSDLMRKLDLEGN